MLERIKNDVCFLLSIDFDTLDIKEQDKMISVITDKVNTTLEEHDWYFAKKVETLIYDDINSGFNIPTDFIRLIGCSNSKIDIISNNNSFMAQFNFNGKVITTGNKINLNLLYISNDIENISETIKEYITLRVADYIGLKYTNSESLLRDIKGKLGNSYDKAFSYDAKHQPIVFLPDGKLSSIMSNVCLLFACLFLFGCSPGWVYKGQPYHSEYDCEKSGCEGDDLISALAADLMEKQHENDGKIVYMGNSSIYDCKIENEGGMFDKYWKEFKKFKIVENESKEEGVDKEFQIGTEYILKRYGLFWGNKEYDTIYQTCKLKKEYL
jgi:hypothetical protein